MPSLAVAAATEVRSGQPSLFEAVPGIVVSPLEFELTEVRQLPDSGLWLHYLRA